MKYILQKIADSYIYRLNRTSDPTKWNKIHKSALMFNQECANYGIFLN